MPPTHLHPRRKDRSQDENWIRSFLHQGEAAVLSAVVDGRPFSMPRIYVFDETKTAVYVHGGFGGATGRVMRQGAGGEGVPMSVTVFEMGRLLPAQEALEFGVEYASVIVSGRASEVADREEVEYGLELLMKKYAPHLEAGKDYRSTTPEEVARTSVIRIDIDAWSGKVKTEADDFPGAYWFKDVQEDVR